jgi:hypothetical protein
MTKTVRNKDENKRKYIKIQEIEDLLNSTEMKKLIEFLKENEEYRKAKEKKQEMEVIG